MADAINGNKKLWNLASRCVVKNYNDVKRIADLNGDFGNHVVDTSNPHNVNKNQVGLGNVDNTADDVKSVLSATKLTTARTINGISFDGTANITVYDSTKVVANSIITAGTGTKITYDSKGLVTGSTTLSASDIPSLDASKLTSGTIDSSRLPSYVDDVIEGATTASFPTIGETGKIYVALDTNKTYRWSGSTYVYITSGAVDSVAGKTGIVTLTSSDVGLSNVSNIAQVTSVTGTAPIVSSGGTTPAISISVATTSNAGSMSATDKTKLDAITGSNTGDETATTIKTKLGITTLSGSNTGDQTITLTGDVTGSGTGNFATTLADSGVTIGTYKSVTVDAKGRVTSGTNPTTLSGYGITDAYTKTQVDTLASNYYTQAQINTLASNYTLKTTTINGHDLSSNVTITSSDVGLGNVDNTSDADKQISTATQSALNLKANTATTLTGYGITDAYTKTQVDALAANYYTKTQVDTLAGNYYTKTNLDGGQLDSRYYTQSQINTLSNDYVLKTTTVNGHSLSSNITVTASDVGLGNVSNTAQVTSVTASGALASSGGTTPVITHSTVDGYLHVPATSTTNNGKFLQAGATAGSLSWVSPNEVINLTDLKDAVITSASSGQILKYNGTSWVNDSVSNINEDWGSIV